MHTPDSSLLCMSLPKADILGLPCTEVITSQAVINASLVHVLSKYTWRISFWCLGSSVLEIVRWTPSWIMPMFRNSLTTALASISAMNRSRNSFRTSSAVYMEKHTPPQHMQGWEVSMLLHIHSTTSTHQRHSNQACNNYNTCTFLAHPAVLTWNCHQRTLDRTRILLNITGEEQQSTQKDVGLNHSFRQPHANAGSTS